MAIATVPCYDAVDYTALPRGQAAGYTTGGGIAWSQAAWNAHPGAVRIDQDPGASDPTADILDVEGGAATFADCPGWSKRAGADYRAASRPGQRSPAIYASMSNIPAVATALVAGGVTSGVGLWVANWSLSQPAAAALVAYAGGPFPIIGVQYANRGSYDVSEFSVPWLQAVSGHTPPPPPPPPPPGGSWAYPAPTSPGGAVSRAASLHWAAVVPPAGHPGPGSYTVALYLGTRLVRQMAVPGLSTVITGLAPGAYTAHIWANGAPSAPPHASFSFTV